MDKAGTEEDEKDGEADPGQELQVDVAHQVVDQPEPGVAAQRDGVVHGEADQGHDDPQEGEEDPVLAYPGESVSPDKLHHRYQPLVLVGLSSPVTSPVLVLTGGADRGGPAQLSRVIFN